MSLFWIPLWMQNSSISSLLCAMNEGQLTVRILCHTECCEETCLSWNMRGALHFTGWLTCSVGFIWFIIVAHACDAPNFTLTLCCYSSPKIQRTSISDHTEHHHLERRRQRILRLQLGTVTRTTKRGKLIRRLLELGGTPKEATRETSIATMVPTMARTPTRDLFDLVSVEVRPQWYTDTHFLSTP
jgi:hypothetical protein